jgi:hypothetical protein
MHPRPSWRRPVGRERPRCPPSTRRCLLRALGLAHHWQRLLDAQRVTSVAEIAEAEGIDVTQVRRLLRLALLAPEVVERLVGTPEATLQQVMRGGWSSRWADHMRVFTSSRGA